MDKRSNILWDKIQSKDVFVIAEIGKNFIQTEAEGTYEEYFKNACRLVDEAKRAGATAVKFQTHCLEDEQMGVEVKSPHFEGSDRYSWVARNSSLTDMGFWEDVRDYCWQEKIDFFSTPMSRGAAVVLEKLDVPIWKVGSGDILDFVMLDFIRRTGKPVIISSGMSSLDELDAAIDFITAKNSRVALMHCVSKYPCPESEVNLGVVDFLRKRYGLPTGFSDHSIGIGEALKAVKMGAGLIEKHFSVDRSLWGSDHKVSLTPKELKELTKKVAEAGPGQKVSRQKSNDIQQLPDSESQFRSLFRKSLVAGCDIKKGTIVNGDMVYAMRPQGLIGGVPSDKFEQIVGRPALVDIKKYEVLNEEEEGLVGINVKCKQAVA
jgi:sialic acid synthase SpsE